MENKSHALWAGFFTIAMLCATVIAGIWLNRDKTVRTEYLIVTSKAISGLNPQASVRYKGLTVGRVDKIEFDPKVVGQIDIQISIDPDTPITKSTFATLGYQGVTGIAFVQLDDDGSNPEKLVGGPAGGVDEPSIPLRAGLLENLERSGTRILANAEVVSERLAQMLTPENQKVILGAFAGTEQVTKRWSKVADDLKPTLQRIPKLAQQTDHTLQSIEELANNATELTKQLSGLANQLQDPNGPLNQTIATYGTLGETMQSEILPKINGLTNEVSRTMHTLNKALEEINERPQELIFGKPAASPGPGEAGFVHPER